MSIDAKLLERCQSKCEFCSSDSNISCYEVPDSSLATAEANIIVCENCLSQIEKPETMQVNHWHCLNESMWSEFSAVQVMAWRLLNRLSGEGWANDLIEQLYLEEDVLAWAKAGLDQKGENSIVTKDSNGATLEAGDTVTLIKDLVVKGANFTAKRGTVVKNISLTDDPKYIEGKVNGTQIVLVAAYLKKVN